MDEVEKLLEKFEALKTTIGWGGAIIALITLLSIVVLWKYLNRAIEKSAEETSEKTIRKFQIQLDKELAEHSVKFSTRHEKQINAVHEIYIRIQHLFQMISFMQYGDKYESERNPHMEMNSIITHRNEFIQIYGLHKIVLPKTTCSKIDHLIPSVDDYINKYQSGLLPKGLALEQQDAPDGEPKLILAGIWRGGTFDEILQKLEVIKNEIEDEFRKIYGT